MEFQDVKIGEFANVLSGYAFKSSEFTEDGIPIIKIKNIRVGSIDLDDVQFVDESYLELEQKFHVRKGDLLISLTGSHLTQPNSVVGRVARYSGPHALLNQRAGKIIFENENICDRTFLYYLLSTLEYKRKLALFASGAASQANISPSQVESLKVKLPNLDTQQKIASTLSAFDDLIENNSRRIEILEEMAQRIYREWFVHFRYPGHEDDELVDSGTELGEVPEGWEVKKLEDLCELTLGQSPKSQFYNNKGEGLPFHQGVRDFGDRYPTTTTWCVKDKRIAEEGDILFSVRAPVGRINIANTKMIIGRGLHSIRSKFDNQVFIFHQLKDKFQEEDSMGSGTIYKSVTKKIMLNLKLIGPGEELIEKFEEKTVPIFKQIKILTDKNEKLKETRDLLLPKLISGKVEVEEVNINYNL